MAHNPVEKRLLQLGNHWSNFRKDESKRLLVWQINENAGRMVECFFEVQKHDTEFATGDLFIIFDSPFENAIQYSTELKESLKGQYEASKEELEKQGIKPDWEYEPEQLPDSAIGFMASMISFVKRHTEISGHIVATFMPQSITNNESFCNWLLTAIKPQKIPENLRLMVMDSKEHPQLSHLIDAKNPYVFVDKPPMDGLTIAQETFAQEGGVGPAAVFRNILLGLVALIEKGSLKQIRVKAKDSLNFAKKQKWKDQEVVVYMLFAGALLKEKQFKEAIREYRVARKAAKQAKKEEHPAGFDLILQTWFGEAGAHLAAGNDKQAAECYDQAAIVAQEVPNLILAIEGFRMAGYCYARVPDKEAAIERGSLTLQLGEKMEPDERPTTTLPLAAVDLLRVIEPEQVKKMEDIKQEQKQQQEKARKAAEEKGAKLESKKDPDLINTVKNQLEADKDKADLLATQRLDVLIESSSETFQSYFSQGRNLLGEEWPLAIDVAFPSSPAC